MRQVPPTAPRLNGFFSPLLFPATFICRTVGKEKNASLDTGTISRMAFLFNSPPYSVMVAVSLTPGAKKTQPRQPLLQPFSAQFIVDGNCH